MSQPVKLSDELVLDAQLTAEAAERSIAGQIEFWAQLGRAVEPLLEGARVLALRRAGAIRPLSACLAQVDSDEGRQRVASFLESSMTNLNFSADENLVDQAQAYAIAQGTTSDRLFQDYLQQISRGISPSEAAEEFARLARLHPVQSENGWRFNREEKNENR